MLEKISINSVAWCEIVFEDKNKKYGAFQLRKDSDKRHLKALIFAVAIVTLSICTPLILKSIKPEKRETNLDVSVISNLIPEKTDVKKDIKIDVPPPVKIKNTIKFNLFQITKDDKVTNENELKTQDELNQSTKAISFKNQIGNDDINGVDPIDLEPKQTDLTENKKTEEPIYKFVEQEPEFMADQTINTYLASNIQYPQLAKVSGIKGTVVVQFVVERDGSVSNVKIERGIGGGCDEEAIRVIKAMPLWKPGKQNGKPVRVSLKIPIVFNLM